MQKLLLEWMRTMNQNSVAAASEHYRPKTEQNLRQEAIWDTCLMNESSKATCV